jgi:hypothetical protein
MRSNVRFVASDLRPVVLDAADATLLQTVLKHRIPAVRGSVRRAATSRHDRDCEADTDCDVHE